MQITETALSERAPHEYEVLDKYSKEYEDIHSVTLKQPTATLSDSFQLTKCPAYASTVPTND